MEPVEQVQVADMTSKERMMAALAHRQPDRTPVFEYVLLSPVADWILGRDYADFGGDRDAWIKRACERGYEATLRQYAADRVELAQRLGHDLIYCVPCPTYDDILSSRRNATLIIEQPAPLDDPVAVIKRRNQDNRAKLDQTDPEQAYLIYDLLKEEMRQRDLDLPIYAPAFMHGIWTDVALMQTMLLEPAAAHEHFKLMTRFALRQIDRYLQADIAIIGIGGDFSGNRPLISPASYRAFIVPELRILSAAIHHGGRYVCNASDGNLWPCIDDFLTGAGADAYGEVDYGAGMDLLSLKERFGRRITFIGNMDSGNVLSFFEPEQIAAVTHACLDAGWGNGGHIFTASNAITRSVPLDHYLAMVNAYRDHFDLPGFHETGGADHA